LRVFGQTFSFEDRSMSVRDSCNYATSEKRRLNALGGPSLYPGFREGIRTNSR
jgi:hypothetical protein